MSVFNFQSESLNPTVAANSTLSLLVGVNGVSLVVKTDGRISALKSWQISGTDSDFQTVEHELRNIFGSEGLLTLPFASKNCLLFCAASTLVPRRLFEPEHLDHYFKLLLRSVHDRSYGFEKIEAFDCYLVWAAEGGLSRLCGQYFSSQQISHIGAPILRAYNQIAPIEGYGVFANLRGQKVQVTVFERRNLVFFNTFDFTKPADLLYYILLAYKQFDLNPLEVPLALSGTLLEDSEIYRLLLRYVRSMHFLPLPDGFQLPDAANALPAHYWFDLAAV
jgi:hypothetical protein